MNADRSPYSAEYAPEASLQNFRDHLGEVGLTQLGQLCEITSTSAQSV